MRETPAKKWIIAATLVAASALALLGGCSMVRLGYSQAPELAYWWLDGYFDFSNAQEPKVREAIASWFAWHRQTQLPDYANLLDRARAELPRDTTPAQTCRWGEEIRVRGNTASEQALPALADLAASLSSEQLRHVSKRMDKSMKEFESDYLQPAPADRAKAALKRAEDRIEMIYGSLEEPQRQVLANALATSPFDAVAWGAERVARQQETLATLRDIAEHRLDRERALGALRRLSEHAQESPSPAYRAYQQRLITFNCALAAQVHNTMSGEQRQAAARRLQGWAEDARALAGIAGAP